MTDAQKKVIDSLHKDFKENCDKYAIDGSYMYCKFHIYFNDHNPYDKNLVVYKSEVFDIVDYTPMTKGYFYLIEQDGKTQLLDDVILNPKQKVAYFNKLKKIQ